MFDDLSWLDFANQEPFRQWFSLILPHERLFIVYLLSSLLMAYLSYLAFRSSTALEKPDTSKGFWKFVFGGEAYTHKSAQQDYVFFITNAVVYYFFAAQFLISNHVFSISVYQLATGIFGPLDAPVLDSAASKIGYTALSLLLGDFAVFLAHYLTHKNPILWHFHKVHHSAEVLNPVTLHRMHPVDLLLNALLAALLISLATGGFFYLSGETPREYTVFGINIVVFLFYILGYNLRHSHIWFSWGQKLSYVFISPAQHQIHHSTAKKHMDKNFGLIFSFWDWMFGTLYVPKQYEKIEFGIRKSEKNPFRSVWEIYVMPFVWSFRDIRDKKAGNFFIIVGIFAFFSLLLWSIYAMTEQRLPRSLHTEELTWTEIWQAQQDGYDTVIIPVGGTEQNGPHIVTGKHNYVVRYTAERIARTAGRALIAPVIAYVPEDPHIAYPGTLHVPEDIFTKLLEAAGDSFLRNGFRYVVFIGDSQGNQQGQLAAAQSLTQKWADKGLHAASLDSYYTANSQRGELLEQGYKFRDIGGHAAMRDTSEMLVVYPAGVRRDSETVYDSQSGLPAGGNGDKSLASRKIGTQMLDLKINAAVRQLESLRTRSE